jgi:hypothetical protein
MSIMDPFQRLLARARSSVEGLEANRALWDARAELETQYSNVVCYEIVAAENVAWSDFIAAMIPRVTEHLSAKGLPMLGGPNAIIAVWRGEKLFLFDSDEFFGALREIEEADESAFWLKIGEWRKAANLTVPRESIRAASSPVAADRALAIAPPASDSIVRNPDDLRNPDDDSSGNRTND